VKISKDTKISALIKANPKSIEAIAGINKHFRKLNNPILRRTLAKRVTIEDAAKIGNTTVDVFFEKLKSIGFTVADAVQSGENISQKQFKSEKMIDIKNGEIVELDVRPDIESGVDPFNRIMSALDTLPEDATLKVINVFEPIPLINLLTAKGYNSEVERPTDGVVITYLKKGAGKKPKLNLKETPKTDLEAFNAKMMEFGANLKTIDVRDMEMPMPMATILMELENLPDGYALFVHHKKLPKFLLPELKNRNYHFLSNRVDASNVKLLIYR